MFTSTGNSVSVFSPDHSGSSPVQVPVEMLRLLPTMIVSSNTLDHRLVLSFYLYVRL